MSNMLSYQTKTCYELNEKYKKNIKIKTNHIAKQTWRDVTMLQSTKRNEESLFFLSSLFFMHVIKTKKPTLTSPESESSMLCCL